MGAELLRETLPSIINGTSKRIKQDETQATYAYTIKREEERIDFKQEGEQIDRLVRGLYDHPYANFTLQGEEHKIVKGHLEKGSIKKVGKVVIEGKKKMGISCANGIYFIDIIKPFGKKEMDIGAFLNGVDGNKIKDLIVNE